jgi:hypothetical protein
MPSRRDMDLFRDQAASELDDEVQDTIGRFGQTQDHTHRSRPGHISMLSSPVPPSHRTSPTPSTYGSSNCQPSRTEDRREHQQQRHEPQQQLSQHQEPNIFSSFVPNAPAASTLAPQFHESLKTYSQCQFERLLFDVFVFCSDAIVFLVLLLQPSNGGSVCTTPRTTRTPPRTTSGTAASTTRKSRTREKPNRRRSTSARSGRGRSGRGSARGSGNRPRRRKRD